MQSMRGIPTAPNSPSYSRVASVEPSAEHEHDAARACAASDFSDFDMMSSIESLPREPWCASPAADSVESIASIATESAASAPAARRSHHGFIMPSLPSLSALDDSVAAGLVGRLNIAVGGARARSELIDVLRRDVLEPPRGPLDAAVVDAECAQHVCSSSRHEQNNITLVDCAAPAPALAAWLEAQFRRAASSARQPGVDALIYVLGGRPDETELAALAQMQQFVAVIPVMPARDPAFATAAGATNAANAAGPADAADAANAENAEDVLARLRAAGLAPFLKRVWTLAMTTAPNYDMAASVVEAAGYRAQVLPPSELREFATALLGASGRARAHTAQLYARWVQAQLAVTSPEPPGALVVRVNLRKSLESIGNLDPLGLAHWCTMPRLVGAVLAGMAAAVGLSAAWARLFPVVPAPPVQCHRHILLDNVLENWTQWLHAE